MGWAGSERTAPAALLPVLPLDTMHSPPAPSVCRWTAEDAADAVKGLARRIADLLDALSARDAKILEVRQFSSGRRGSRLLGGMTLWPPSLPP